MKTKVNKKHSKTRTAHYIKPHSTSQNKCLQQNNNKRCNKVSVNKVFLKLLYFRWHELMNCLKYLPSWEDFTALSEIDGTNFRQSDWFVIWKVLNSEQWGDHDNRREKKTFEEKQRLAIRANHCCTTVAYFAQIVQPMIKQTCASLKAGFLFVRAHLSEDPTCAVRDLVRSC